MVPHLRTPPSASNSPKYQSLTAKRALQQGQAPGMLDLSALPQFSAPHLASASGLDAQRCSTPTPTTDPPAVNRPRLHSRWSSDSEGSNTADADAKTSAQIEAARNGSHETQHVSVSAGHRQAGPAKASTQKRCLTSAWVQSSTPAAGPQVTSRRTHIPRLSDSAISLPPDPFLLALIAPAPEIAPPVSIPSTPSRLASLLPPAPKPHQHGFSPVTEDPPPLTGSAPAISEARADCATRSTNPPNLSYFTFQPVSSNLPRHRWSVSGSSTSSASSSTTAPAKPRSRSLPYNDLYGEADSPPDSPLEAPTHSVVRPDQGRLTRSQGLRIKDESVRLRERFSRSLSTQLQLQHSRDLTRGHGHDSGLSSTIRSANALLNGTISPAEMTTDPLRVRLREMPGLVTPDASGLPPLLSMPTTPADLFGSGAERPNLKQTWHRAGPFALSASASTPRSPLHMSTTASGSDTTNNLFSENFSFAHPPSNAHATMGHSTPRHKAAGSVLRESAISPTQAEPVASSQPQVRTGVNPYFASVMQ